MPSKEMILICVKDVSKVVKEWGMYLRYVKLTANISAPVRKITASVVYMTGNLDLQNTNAVTSAESC